MGEVTGFTGKYRRPRVLQGGKVWAAPKPSDLMTWEVCPYLRPDNECSGCAEWEQDERYGRFKRGCRAMAEEACRVVMAVQQLEAATPSESSVPGEKT